MEQSRSRPHPTNISQDSGRFLRVLTCDASNILQTFKNENHPQERNQLILSLILPNHTCENPLIILLLIHPSWIIALALVISRFKIGFTLRK